MNCGRHRAQVGSSVHAGCLPWRLGHMAGGSIQAGVKCPAGQRHPRPETPCECCRWAWARWTATSATLRSRCSRPRPTTTAARQPSGCRCGLVWRGRSMRPGGCGIGKLWMRAVAARLDYFTRRKHKTPGASALAALLTVSHGSQPSMRQLLMAALICCLSGGLHALTNCTDCAHYADCRRTPPPTTSSRRRSACGTRWALLLGSQLAVGDCGLACSGPRDQTLGAAPMGGRRMPPCPAWFPAYVHYHAPLPPHFLCAGGARQLVPARVHAAQAAQGGAPCC